MTAWNRLRSVQSILDINAFTSVMCRYRVNLLQIESLKLASTEDQFVLKEARRCILRRRNDAYTRLSSVISAIIIMRLWYIAMRATSTD